jgi:hypothetical protein
MSDYEAEFPGFHKFLAGYLAALAWTSLDDDGISMDVEPEEADDGTAAEGCAAFLRVSLPDGRTVFEALLPYDMRKAGHDFLLTRNEHGAGFWDGDYGADGEALTEACRDFGHVDLYTGDDGVLYSAGWHAPHPPRS